MQQGTLGVQGADFAVDVVELIGAGLAGLIASGHVVLQPLQGGQMGLVQPLAGLERPSLQIAIDNGRRRQQLGTAILGCRRRCPGPGRVLVAAFTAEEIRLPGSA